MATFQELLKSRPDFKSPLDQNTWKMNPALTNSAYGKLSEKALVDPSAWEAKLNTAQGLEQQKALEQAQLQSAAGTAGIQSRLAMRGGIGGGAMERAATQGANNLMQANTSIGMQGALQRANNTVTADDRQNAMLESAGAGQQVGIANVLGQNQMLNEANLGTYNAQMQAAAAQEQAKATAKAAAPGRQKFLGIF